MTVNTDPSAILKTALGFWESKVLLTAVGLGLFTKLGDRAMTGKEIEEALSLHPRGTWDFLDALVSMNFLERHGNGHDALYRNTVDTQRFLDKNSEFYIGGVIEMLDARLFRYWNDLGEALKTGKPQNETKHSGTSIFEELYRDEAGLEQFMGAMAGLSRGNFEALAEKFDFSRYKKPLRRGRGDRALVLTGGEEASASEKRLVRPACGRADSRASHRARRAFGPRFDCLGRFLQGSAP